MKASLKNYHQPPRKVRLVADLIRGKSVPQARAALSFLPKKSAPDIAKLLDSAVANARQQNFAAEDLFVKSIAVNKGIVMRRYRPFARGRAGSIRKTLSIVTLELGSTAGPKAAPKVAAKKAAKKTAKKAAKKTAAKTEATE
ncbi:MAG TPA: 50S ribosomal protein L22 [Candidatus Paceibacterota bacterium]|nr:50S ribosomal protein L22 [Candidatus Paceibacterota bacterium]